MYTPDGLALQQTKGQGGGAASHNRRSLSQAGSAGTPPTLSALTQKGLAASSSLQTFFFGSARIDDGGPHIRI